MITASIMHVKVEQTYYQGYITMYKRMGIHRIDLFLILRSQFSLKTKLKTFYRYSYYYIPENIKCEWVVIIFTLVLCLPRFYQAKLTNPLTKNASLCVYSVLKGILTFKWLKIMGNHSPFKGTHHLGNPTPPCSQGASCRNTPHTDGKHLSLKIFSGK